MNLQLGPFRIDRAARVLYRHGDVVPLTPKAFDTLLFLVDRAGEVVTKEELLKGVWPDARVEEGSLARNISSIRQALGERRGSGEYIQTISKRGYRLVGPVEGLRVPPDPTRTLALDPPAVPASPPAAVTAREAGDPGPAGSTPPPVSSPARSESRLLPRLLIGPALLTVVVLLVAVSFLTRGAATPAAAVHVRSMAVLPFEADRGHEYLGVGLADALAARLAPATSVTIPSAATTRIYLKAGKDGPGVGRAMGVDAVLEGQLRVQGNRLALHLRLVRVADGALIWSHDAEDRAERLFFLQDAVARRVESALASPAPARSAGARSSTATSVPARAGTADVAAYRLYLRAQYARERRDREGFATAKRFLEEAVGLDPRFAPAYVVHAEILLNECWMGWVPVRETEARAEALLGRALSLDPDLAAAHGTRGQLRWQQWRWAELKEDLERAIALAPQEGRWYDQYAVQYSLPQRRFDEGLRLLRRAQALDPLSRITGSHVASALFYMGRLDEAIAEHRQVLQLEPRFGSSHFGLGQIYAEQRRFDLAEEAYGRALEIWPDQTAVLAALGHLWAEAGQPAKARDALARIARLEPNRGAAAYLRANVYMGLGDPSRALTSLEEALALRDTHMVWCGIEPDFRPLYGERRFRRILESVGLALPD